MAAATAYSDSLPQAERDPARAFAEGLGVRVLTPQTHEMDREGYRANDGDRCYFCKAELLDVLAPLAAEHGFAAVATGTNADDARAGFRPGIRAASERGAATPLQDAGFTKDQVRAASRRWDLPTWDKPAAACLSSRVAYGIEVTPHRLARVERAEAAVRRVLDEAGTPARDLRVRDLGDRGSVELDAVLLVRAAGRRHARRGRGARRGPRGRLRGGRPRPARLPLRVDERVARPTLPLNPLAPAPTPDIGWRTAERSTPENEVIPVPTGKVKWYDADKGFGFLSQEDGPDVYVRAEALPDGVSTLKAGTRVEFGIAQGRKGDQALQVRVLDAPASVSRNQSKAQRKKPEEMATIVEDLIRLLDDVGESYRRGRHPDARSAKPTAKLLRALADELEL